MVGKPSLGITSRLSVNRDQLVRRADSGPYRDLESAFFRICCRFWPTPFESLEERKVARNKMTNLVRIVGVLGFASLVYAQAVQPSAARLALELGKGFESRFAQVNGTRIHYVRGGSGPALVLLHGFPEDWYEFRLLMPRLAKTFTVVAVGFRRVGGIG